MLQVSIWTRLITLIIVVGGILIALPNALSPGMRAKIPHGLPSSAVNLGLDLQGGSYLLLQVDLNQVTRDRAETMVGDIRAAFRKAHIPLSFDNGLTKDDTVAIKVADPARMDEARTLLQSINPSVGTAVLSTSGKQYDMSEPGGGTFVLRQSDAFKTLTRQQVLDQSIEVVRRRIDALGTGELIKLLGQTAKMSFQLVDEQADPNAPVAPIGDEILPLQDNRPGSAETKIVVQRRVLVAGDRVTGASQGFDQQTGQPEVDFRMDSVGAKQFGDVTTEHLGHRFAIVLDKKVISAPTIQSPILGGSGRITGAGTAKEANDLAILLRAGALPARLVPIEERSVGAELGADSINAGRYSALAGLGLVGLFMVLRYGLFGLFADVALTLNVVLLLAALTAFGATLTLPGIAGIVLTMGMAVDANVLIFERIREEQRNGRSMLASVDQGFRRAMATIIDANMTHLIASLILFELGTGPVQGFAVTLGVGIITSFFTSVLVTRLIVIGWLNAARPRKLTI
jgi:protein-export membrane protein SecD